MSSLRKLRTPLRSLLSGALPCGRRKYLYFIQQSHSFQVLIAMFAYFISRKHFAELISSVAQFILELNFAIDFVFSICDYGLILLAAGIAFEFVD